MRTAVITLVFLVLLQLISENLDTTFFPQFVHYSQSPVVHYGDDVPGSPWNDPCVLKENEQYIMYTSSVQGGLNHLNETLGIYR